jgi:hypothetical protein
MVQVAAEAVVAVLLQQLAAGDTSTTGETAKRQLWWQQVGDLHWLRTCRGPLLHVCHTCSR